MKEVSVDLDVVEDVSMLTGSFSGSDLRELCRRTLYEAAHESFGKDWNSLSPLTYDDFFKSYCLMVQERDSCSIGDLGNIC